MSGAVVGGLIMLAALAAVFVVASYPGSPDGWVARLGRGGLLAVLLAVGVAVVGVSIVVLPEAIVVGAALMAAGVLLLAIAALAALRGRPSDRPRGHAPHRSESGALGPDADEDARP